MDNQETPITKYLASLDRRKSALGESPETPNFQFIKQRINFDDDTFFMDGDKSLLHVSSSTSGSNKRKRTSLYDYIESKTPSQNSVSTLSKPKLFLYKIRQFLLSLIFMLSIFEIRFR